MLEQDSTHQLYSITVDDFDYDGYNDIAYAGFANCCGGVYWYENETDLLGLNDNELSSIKIYPNPTTNKLYFKSAIVENFKVSVFDILGKKVIEDSLNTNNALDVSQLHTGIYIIRFNDYNTTFKFVKE